MGSVGAFLEPVLRAKCPDVFTFLFKICLSQLYGSATLKCKVPLLINPLSILWLTDGNIHCSVLTTLSADRQLLHRVAEVAERSVLLFSIREHYKDKYVCIKKETSALLNLDPIFPSLCVFVFTSVGFLSATSFFVITQKELTLYSVIIPEYMLYKVINVLTSDICRIPTKQNTINLRM